MRTWEGNQITVTITRGEGWRDITVEREKGEGFWEEAISIDDRSPDDNVHDIWVAEFKDKTEAMIEWRLETDELRVGWRDDWWSSWSRPIVLTEMVSS